MNNSTPLRKLKRAWVESSLGSECTLHQLAPYIGKLKTTLASTLISEFSRPGHIVFDPFSGSGVVPLESLLLSRGTIANDVSPYAAVLTRAKLHVPLSEEFANRTARRYLERAKLLADQCGHKIEAPLSGSRFLSSQDAC
jgi:adenine-specific DNA methylase